MIKQRKIDIHWLFLLAVSLSTTVLNAQGIRKEYLFRTGWKFTRADVETAKNKDFNDKDWQTVTVPHDWAIYGPFSLHNDKQNVAISQDGQKEAMEHAGRTGGLPFVGVGWYRLKFNTPEFGPERRATLVFDGAMSHARVFVNGSEVGYWPYGYSSFYFDVTDYLNPKGENVLAVRLENKAESSRWYPGAGLYRNVHLVLSDQISVKTWGTQITTPVIKADYAKVCVKTEVQLPKGVRPSDVEVETHIRNGAVNVCSLRTALTQYDDTISTQELIIKNPKLWDCDTPHLYTALTKIYHKGVLKDEYSSPFGIRSIAVVPEKGFFLNGKKVIFQGTCNHHDLGALGAAVNIQAIRRRVKMLKDMGCNAYRTSHNMPSPELVQVCDEMGMLLMAETFDEWQAGKVANGYHRVFKDWVEKDVVNLVKHYRNAPSIVMWCTGNEVPDQGTANGGKISRMIQDLFHREDPTRPCTQGMDQPGSVLNNNFAAVMDVPGFNYRPFMYKEAYKKLPQQVLIGSETASTISSRGVYKFPVQRRAMAKYEDHQASSYDVEHCSWSDLPEDNFMMYEDLPYDMGEFVWTGFDYLGEPTPYYSDWPSHSSLFGIIDLAGIPKDRYYLYRSFWNKKAETLHIVPHWTWPGREGETTPVFVYTNYPTVELFINGKSQGKQTKDTTVAIDATNNAESQKKFDRQKRYRLMWMNTSYEPGTLKAVAYDAQGNKCIETEVKTAGKPYRIELVPDSKELILEEGVEALVYVQVRIVDKDGNLCPHASDLVRFQVSGDGVYKAGANGDPTCLESFQKPQMHVFNGMMTAIVADKGTTGVVKLKAESKGLKSAEVKLQVLKNSTVK